MAIVEQVLENQRLVPLRGWVRPRLPRDYRHWTNLDGKHTRKPAQLHLIPGGNFDWQGEWEHSEWRYGRKFRGYDNMSEERKGTLDTVRSRIWSRKRTRNKNFNFGLGDAVFKHELSDKLRKTIDEVSAGEINRKKAGSKHSRNRSMSTARPLKGLLGIGLRSSSTRFRAGSSPKRLGDDQQNLGGRVRRRRKSVDSAIPTPRKNSQSMNMDIEDSEDDDLGEAKHPSLEGVDAVSSLSDELPGTSPGDHAMLVNERVFEIQRFKNGSWEPIKRYAAWVDENEQPTVPLQERTAEKLNPSPASVSGAWRWVTPTSVSLARRCDEAGWSYGRNATKCVHRDRKPMCTFRRRHWFRIRVLDNTEYLNAQEEFCVFRIIRTLLSTLCWHIHFRSDSKTVFNRTAIETQVSGRHGSIGAAPPAYSYCRDTHAAFQLARTFCGVLASFDFQRVSAETSKKWENSSHLAITRGLFEELNALFLECYMADAEKTYDEGTSFELATRLAYCVELVSLLRQHTQFVSQRNSLRNSTRDGVKKPTAKTTRFVCIGLMRLVADTVNEQINATRGSVSALSQLNDMTSEEQFANVLEGGTIQLDALAVISELLSYLENNVPHKGKRKSGKHRAPSLAETDKVHPIYQTVRDLGQEYAIVEETGCYSKCKNRAPSLAKTDKVHPIYQTVRGLGQEYAIVEETGASFAVTLFEKFGVWLKHYHVNDEETAGDIAPIASKVLGFRARLAEVLTAIEWWVDPQPYDSRNDIAAIMANSAAAMFMRCKEHLPDEPTDCSVDDWERFSAEFTKALTIDMEVFHPRMKNFGHGVAYPAQYTVATMVKLLAFEVNRFCDSLPVNNIHATTICVLRLCCDVRELLDDNVHTLPEKAVKPLLECLPNPRVVVRDWVAARRVFIFETINECVARDNFQRIDDLMISSSPVDVFTILDKFCQAYLDSLRLLPVNSQMMSLSEFLKAFNSLVTFYTTLVVVGKDKSTEFSRSPTAKQVSKKLRAFDKAVLKPHADTGNRITRSSSKQQSNHPHQIFSRVAGSPARNGRAGDGHNRSPSDNFCKAMSNGDEGGPQSSPSSEKPPPVDELDPRSVFAEDLDSSCVRLCNMKYCEDMLVTMRKTIKSEVHRLKEHFKMDIMDIINACGVSRSRDEYATDMEMSSEIVQNQIEEVVSWISMRVVYYEIGRSLFVHLYTRNPQGDLINVSSDVLVELEDVFDYIEEMLDDNALQMVAERIFDEFVAALIWLLTRSARIFSANDLKTIVEDVKPIYDFFTQFLDIDYILNSPQAQELEKIRDFLEMSPADLIEAHKAVAYTPHTASLDEPHLAVHAKRASISLSHHSASANEFKSFGSALTPSEAGSDIEEASLALTPEALAQLILLLMARHYDAACREYSRTHGVIPVTPVRPPTSSNGDSAQADHDALSSLPSSRATRLLRKAPRRAIAKKPEEYEFSVLVKLFSATELSRTSSLLSARSDLYVIAEVGAQKKRSKTIKRSLSPVWNEEFLFGFDLPTDGEDSPHLELTMYDWKLTKKDVRVGTVKIPLLKLHIMKKINFLEALIRTDNLVEPLGNPLEAHGLTWNGMIPLLKLHIMKKINFLEALIRTDNLFEPLGNLVFELCKMSNNV